MLLSRESVQLVAGAGLTALMTIGYIVYVGRVVGPEEYADFSASLSIIYFVGLTLSPLTPTIARVTAAYRARGTTGSVFAVRAIALRRIASIAVVVCGAGAIASVLLFSALRFRTAAPLVLAFAAVLLYSIVSVDRGVVQGLLLFRFYNANVVIEAAVRLVLAAVLLLVTPSAALALAGYVVALGVAEVLMAARMRRERGEAQPATVDWSDVQRVAVPIVVLMFAIAAFQNTDMLAVKRWFAAADAGSYGAATAIARGVGVVFVPFYVVAGPLLTSLHETGKPVFAPTLRLAASFLLAVLIPLALIIAVPRVLLSTLYGPAFSNADVVLAPLAGVTVITYAGLMLSQALLTMNDRRFLIGYIVCAAAQVAGLALFHDTFSDVLRVLYVTQTAALLSVSAFFIHAWNVRRREIPC